MRQEFAAADANSDGVLTFSEFRKTQEANETLRKEFAAADANSDGVLCFSEYRAMRRKPDMKQAMDMPRDFWEMSNEVLLLMAARGMTGAQRERLVREVMAVDNVDWRDAQPRVDAIAIDARCGAAKYELPFILGSAAVSVAALVSFPMVFNLSVAEWFNDGYVTGEHPPMKELQTWLEVGGWTWNWMEPLIGTLSFAILSAQLSRGLLIQCAVYVPWASRISALQARKIKAKYPQYHPNILEDFVSGLPRH
jgi:hypothetical protein